MTEPVPRAAPPATLVGAVMVLTVAACLGAALGWPLPERTLSGWQVTAVPASLLALITGTAVVCVLVAAALVRPASLGSPAAVGTWWAVTVAAAAALVWNDLYFAALSTGDGGAVIPVFDWMFTFVPAVVVGAVTRRLGRPRQLRAVLGTAVVAVPLLGLSWAVTGESGAVVDNLLGGIYGAVIFGVVPLLLAFLVTRAPASGAPVTPAR